MCTFCQWINTRYPLSDRTGTLSRLAYTRISVKNERSKVPRLLCISFGQQIVSGLAILAKRQTKFSFYITVGE
jgi:hypothetical protein